MRRILVVRFGALGDLVLATALLAGLRREAPDAEIWWVTKQAWSGLLEADSRIDRLIALEPGQSIVSLARCLDAVEFDLVIDAHANLRSRALVSLLRPTPARRLEKDTWARWVLMRGGPLIAPLRRSLVDRYHELTPDSRPHDRPRIFVGTSAAARASSIMGDGTAWLAVAPGAKHAAKRWPAERFAEAVKIHAHRHGCRVLVVGGPEESEAMQFVADAVEPSLIWPADQPLEALAAALQRCSLLLCNDSGLSHLAEAVDTPVVVIFGPTVRAWGYFPLDPQSRVVEQDVSCRPCSKAGERSCRQTEPWCLTQSTVELVSAQLEDAWTKVTTAPASR